MKAFTKTNVSAWQVAIGTKTIRPTIAAN